MFFFFLCIYLFNGRLNAVIILSFALFSLVQPVIMLDTVFQLVMWKYMLISIALEFGAKLILFVVFEMCISIVKKFINNLLGLLAPGVTSILPSRNSCLEYGSVF